MDSIRILKRFVQSWKYATIFVIIIGVRGVGESKSEKQLLIANGEGEFDQDVFAFSNKKLLKLCDHQLVSTLDHE
jgi:hypothetical protein